MKAKSKNMRILNHPILGKMEPKETVMIEVDGKAIDASKGEPIAAALAAAGIKVFHYTRKYNEPRGIFCAIGQCTDCVMVINGVPNTRTCITPVEEGMKIETQYGLGRKE